MVNGRSKVVPLKSGSGSGGGRNGPQTLPLPLARLRERVSPILQRLIQSLFDQADDALFELADRASSNTEQNAFFESMREVRIRRRGIEQGMARRLESSLYTLVSGGRPTGAPDLEAISGSDLSLVEHEELEQLVAADSMAAKGEKQYSELLQTLTLRLDTLSLDQKITLKTNPLAPAALCQHFIDECQPLEMDIKAKLVLFKMFDRQVVAHLEPFYQQANQVLMDEGILPSLSAADSAARSSETPPPSPAAGSGEQVFTQLSQLLNQVRDSGNTAIGSGLVAPGAAPALPRDALMQLLAEVQRRQIQQLMRAPEQLLGDPGQLDVLRAMNQLLQTTLPDRAVSIGQHDDDAINLVSMLFQFILEDRNLAPPIKGLLARLQIPILKLALQDKSVFGKSGHPARKFLNEVATASLGWTPAGPLEKDPFYRKVEALVGRVLNEYNGEVALFQEVLADFVSFVERERRRATLVERRIIDAEDGRARADAARQTVRRALDERIAGRELPPAITHLLEDGWSHVLFLACLRDGLDSDAWRDAMLTVDEVLDSVRPATDAAERTLLVRRLPNLLKQLRTGLTRIGYNPHDMNQLFEDLERIHLARLQPSEPAASPVSQPPSLAHDEADLDELDRELDAALGLDDAGLNEQFGDALAGVDAGPGSMPEQHTDREQAAIASEAEAVPAAAEADSGAEPAIAEPAAPEPSLKSLARVEALRAGCWVEFRDEDQRVTRCRLAAILKTTGKYIFVSRAGIKVAEETAASLALILDQGRVEFLDDGQLFDRALESVIGNLREMKRSP